MGKPQIFGKFIRLDLFFLRDTAGSAATIEIDQMSIIEINSQHPHLLGFDSNLVPNSSSFIISAVSLGGFRIFGTIRDICMYLSVPSWENPKYLGNSLDWIYFSYRIQQGLLLLSNTSNIHWIWEEQPKYLAKSSKVAVKWQKLPDQHRKFLNFWNNHCTIAR